MRTIRQIIYDAGIHRIVTASAGSETPITAKGVYNWFKLGIPQRHWPVIMKLARSSEAEIFKANQSVGDEPPRPRGRQRAA